MGWPEDLGPYRGGFRVWREVWRGSGVHVYQTLTGAWANEAWVLGATITLHRQPFGPGSVLYNGNQIASDRITWARNVATLPFTPEAEDTIECVYEG